MIHRNNYSYSQAYHIYCAREVEKTESKAQFLAALLSVTIFINYFLSIAIQVNAKTLLSLLQENPLVEADFVEALAQFVEALAQ